MRTKKTNLLRCGPTLEMIRTRFRINISSVTLRDWAKRKGFGRKIAGRWYYDVDKINQFLEEKH